MGKYMTSSLLLQGRIRGVYTENPILDINFDTNPVTDVAAIEVDGTQGGVRAFGTSLSGSRTFRVYLDGSVQNTSRIFTYGPVHVGGWSGNHLTIGEAGGVSALSMTRNWEQLHLIPNGMMGYNYQYVETSTGVPTLYIQNDGDPATGSNSWMRMYVDSSGHGHIEGGGASGYASDFYIGVQRIHLGVTYTDNLCFRDSLSVYGGLSHANMSPGGQDVSRLIVGAANYGWHLMRYADAGTQPTAVPDQENALYFWPADGGTKYLRIYTDSSDVGHIGGTCYTLNIDRYLKLNHSSWDWDSRIFGYHSNTPTIGFHNNSGHQIHFVDSSNLYTDYSETDQGVPTIYLHNDGTPTGGDDAWVRWKVNSSGNAYIEHGGSLPGSLMYSGFSRVTFDGMLYASSIYSTPGATAYGGIEFSRSSYPYARLYLGTNTYGWHIMRYADVGTQPVSVPDQENALYFWPNNGGTFYGRIYVDSTQKFYIQAPANGMYINGSVSILGGSWGLSMSRILFYAGGTSGADARATFAFGVNSDNQLHLTPSAYRASSAYHEADLGVPTLYIQNDGDPASGANSWLRMYVASSGAKTIEGSSTSGHLYIKNGSNFIYLQAGAFYVPMTCYGLSYSQQGGIVGTQLTTAWVNTLMTGYATSGAGAGYGWHVAANYNPPDAIPNDYHASFYIWPDDNSNHYTRFYTTTAGDGYMESKDGELNLIADSGGKNINVVTDALRIKNASDPTKYSDINVNTSGAGRLILGNAGHGVTIATSLTLNSSLSFYHSHMFAETASSDMRISTANGGTAGNQFHIVPYLYRNNTVYTQTDLGVPTLYLWNSSAPASAKYTRFYTDSSSGNSHWENPNGNFYIESTPGTRGNLYVGKVTSTREGTFTYLRSTLGSSYGGSLVCPNDSGSPPTPGYNSTIQFTVDESASSNQLTVSVRYSDGTVKTATLTLS